MGGIVSPETGIDPEPAGPHIRRGDGVAHGSLVHAHDGERDMAYNCNEDPFQSLRQATAPNWVEALRREMQVAGPYAAVDLRRLLGDPARGVEIGPSSQAPHQAACAEPSETADQK
jgi:hypothetical protein